MPAQTRRPTKNTPTTSGTSTGTPTTATQGPQAGLSSGAATDHDEEFSLEEGRSLLTEHTESAEMSVGGMLPAGMLLAETDGDRISTGKATQFYVGVGRDGLFANFRPPIEVQPGSFWARATTGGVTIDQIWWSFKSGRSSVILDTGAPGDILDFFFDFKDRIEAQIGASFGSHLPARVRQPGFDPYTDPELPALLDGAVRGMSGAFTPDTGGKSGASKDADGLMNAITSPSLRVTVQPKPIEIPLENGMILTVNPRSSLTLDARLAGRMADAMEKPSVAALSVMTDGIELRQKTGGKLASVKLKKLSLGSDLSVTQLDYDLAIEETLSALKALGALLQLQSGQDLGIRDTQSVRLNAVRETINTEARQKIPEMLRQQILEHDTAIPGFSLKSMFKG